MLIAVLQYISGYLRIRVEGYSPERFINLCSYHGIYLWNLKPCGHAYEMNISVRGFRELKPVIRKTRTKVVIMERAGFPFFFTQIPKAEAVFRWNLLLYYLCLCHVAFCMEYPYRRESFADRRDHAGIFGIRRNLPWNVKIESRL